MSNFAKKVILTTPIGVAEPFCHIQKPDYGNPEKGINKPRGEYRVMLTVGAKAAQPFIDKIDAAHKASYDKLVSTFNREKPQLLAKLGRGKTLQEPYEGNLPYFINDDGTVTFTVKGYASYTTKETREVKQIPLRVYDAKGVRIENVPAISGGSELKVKFSLFPYGWSPIAGASVKLQMESVMLVSLKEFSGGGDEWADETEEGGYEDEGNFQEDAGGGGQGDQHEYPEDGYEAPPAADEDF